MTLIWDEAESDAVKTRLRADLEVWQPGLVIWQYRIATLVATIDAGNLSGAAYNTAKTLFEDRVQPLVEAGLRVCRAITQALALYEMYEAPLRDDAWTHLESAALLQGGGDLERQLAFDAMWHLFPAPWRAADSDVAPLVTTLNETKTALRDLGDFTSNTRALFDDAMRAQQSIEQGVRSINSGSVASDGTYAPGANDKEAWLAPVTQYWKDNPFPDYDDTALQEATILTGPVISSEADITIDSVNQGNAGDCWYIATLAAMANQPAGRDALYQHMTWNAAKGCYVVTLYFDGKAETYNVDTVYGDGAHGTQWGQPAWTSVYEDALIQYAQAHYGGNGLDWITDDSGSTAMTILTGKPAESQTLDVATLTAALAKGDLVTVASLENGATLTSPSITIVADHIYTVMSIDGNGTVTLRNPWGDTNTAGPADITLSIAQLEQYFPAMSIGSA
jgi:hypothetical protein